MSDLAMVTKTPTESFKRDYSNQLYLEIIDDNLNFLSMYSSIKVPNHQLHSIIAILKMRGKTTIDNLLKVLNESNPVLARQYIHVLMFKDFIDFEITKPIHANTEIWLNEDFNEFMV